MKLFGLIAAALVALAPLVSTAQADPAAMPATLASGQKFVQAFYDWYYPKAEADQDGPSCALALKDKPQDFAPALAAALKADMDAQAKVSDDIVGLDFDPFLNAQDFVGPYVTGAAHWQEKEKALLVDVYGTDAGKRPAKPTVVAEIAFAQGHWMFVNFEYPGDGDLLSILATLKAEREKHP